MGCLTEARHYNNTNQNQDISWISNISVSFQNILFKKQRKYSLAPSFILTYTIPINPLMHIVVVQQ